MENTFTQIWRNGDWVPPGGGASSSGCGSTAKYTENLRRELPRLIEQLAIQSMLDAPCGDFAWMKLVGFPAGFRYIGGDIVRPLIAELRSEYPQHDFRQFDVTAEALPGCDLFLCRDCLIHFSYRDIARALRGFAASDVKLILTTSYPAIDNVDIATGVHTTLLSK